MTKKSYMFTLKLNMSCSPGVFFETPAKNPKEAEKIAKDFFKEYVKNPEFIEDLIQLAVEEKEESMEIKSHQIISMGRAAQYHSPAECEICLKIEKEEAS